MESDEEMKVSNCCGAEFYDQAENNYGGGYAPNEVCSCCGEHADTIEQDEPSINVIEMPELPDNAQEIFERIKNEKS